MAQARVDRAAADGVRTSLLSADGLAGVEAAGFEMVGEVLGTAVMQIGFSGWGGCGWTPGYGGGGFGGGMLGPSTVSRSSPWSGYDPYVRAVRHGWDTALNRMYQEATALGADGVVGVRLTEERMDNQKREFMVLGTAVRSRGRQRPDRLFTTDLNGQDFAKLISAGWVPSGIAYGIDVAVRHDDWRTRQQVGVWAGNTEVSGYTELLTHVRAQARTNFTRLAAKLGGDAALLSNLWSRMWPIEVGENHTDHVAECMITGNAIARFHTGDKPLTSSLTILPLRSIR